MGQFLKRTQAYRGQTLDLRGHNPLFPLTFQRNFHPIYPRPQNPALTSAHLPQGKPGAHRVSGEGDGVLAGGANGGVAGC